MNISQKIGFFVLVAALGISCEVDYRSEAVGGLGKAVVVMDSTKMESATAEAIRQTYGKGIPTLRSLEPRFDLRFRSFKNNDQLDRIKRRSEERRVGKECRKRRRTEAEKQARRE